MFLVERIFVKLKRWLGQAQVLTLICLFTFLTVGKDSGVSQRFRCWHKHIFQGKSFTTKCNAVSNSYISRVVCAILFAISECAETSSSILKIALARPRGCYMIGKVGMPSIDLGEITLKPPTTHKEWRLHRTNGIATSSTATTNQSYGLLLRLSNIQARLTRKTPRLNYQQF